MDGVGEILDVIQDNDPDLPPESDLQEPEDRPNLLWLPRRRPSAPSARACRADPGGWAVERCDACLGFHERTLA